jgi:amino acid transporter
MSTPSESGFAVLAQKKVDEPCVESWGSSYAVWGFVWFVIIIAILFFLFVSFGGEWFEDSCSESKDKKKCDRNWGRPLMWAVIAALVIIILFWVLSSLGGARKC